MTLTVLLVVVFFAGVLCAPPRPVPPEVFEAAGTISLHVKNESHEGSIFWAADQPKGMEVHVLHFGRRSEHDRYMLSLYDKQSHYEILGTNNGTCVKTPLSGTMPLIWDWVASATYKGQIHVRDRVLDIWQFDQGHATIRLGVEDANPNTPIFLHRKAPQAEHTIIFHRFGNHTPHPSVFAVPKSCQGKEEDEDNVQSRCLSRSTAISRAAVWVANHVPYNQGATYGGYREDCSGYVSMSWELSKPGLTTFTLPTVCSWISKDDLQAGDVLLDTQEHVVLFGGWADSSRSQYTAYEETRPGEGTVKRVTPYPYWYNKSAFKPCRYRSMC